ncbi:MAG: tetratricopeptide repeat protein [Bacteroidota bacterium]|nr:tetratricopeptide repeat protein [Bacteroidota bacterium]
MNPKKKHLSEKSKQGISFSLPEKNDGTAHIRSSGKELGFSAFGSFKIQSLILVVLGFILYSNSFTNEYALDDGIVIQKNDYVQRGVRGIPKILTTDAYDSFYRQMHAKQQLSGGRYRPLSVVTFAIEQELFGSKEKEKPDEDAAFIRHVLNVVFYILSILVLLYFLRNFIFKDDPLIAFIACLIFLIHPIHTEVVANVKSRDEILSFLFIILTFIALLRYHENKEKKQLFYGMVFYFLAFLSKEYAITLLLLIPMLLYIVKGSTLKESIISTIPFILVAAIYLFIRFSIVGKGGEVENPDVLNNPFKFATTPEKWATKIEILNHYLRLLFYPNPLSSDYSYNTIPYTNFSNGLVWMSIMVHLSMITATFILFFKRNILSFALAFYLLHLFLVSNFLMDLGATMGERLVYHSSFGFAVMIAVLIVWLLNKIKQTKTKIIIGIALGILVISWCTIVVIKRNAQWKNDTSLFIADAQTVPNSALVNGNAGKAYIDLSEKPENKAQEKELIIKAIYHLSKSVAIHKEYVNGYLNIGVAYFKLKDYDKARANWDIAKNIYPNNPFLKNNLKLMGTVYFNDAMNMGSKRPLEALKLLEKALEVDPNNADYWYNLGGVSYTVGDFEKAREAWTKTLLLDPNNQEAKQGMSALPNKLK